MPTTFSEKVLKPNTTKYLGARTAAQLRLSVWRGREQFLLLQGLHLLCYWFFIDGVSATLLALSGLMNGILISVLLRHEFENTRTQFHPFFVFLVASLMRSSLGTIWVAAALATGHDEALRLGPVPVPLYLMEGHGLLTAGDWLFILSFSLWSLGSSKATAPISLAPSRHYAKLAIGLLAVGWAIKLMVRVGIPLDKLGHFSSLFINYASPAAIYLLFINLKAFGRGSRTQHYALFLLILAIELWLSLSSYMKSGTLVLLIAIALCGSFSALQRTALGRRPFTLKQITTGIAMGIFVLLVLFPYAQLRRNELWSGRIGWGSKGVISILGRTAEAAIPGTSQFHSVHRFPSNGFWSFFSRQSDAIPCSWVIQYVDGTEHLHGEFIEGAIWNLVPRFVWPDKPLYYPGRHVSVMLGYANTAEQTTTSTGVGGIAPSWYLNYGLAGVVLGCLLSGVAFGLVTTPVVRQMHANPLSTMIYVAVIHESLTHFESALDGGITVYFYWMLVFLPMLYLSRRVLKIGPVSSNSLARRTTS